MTKIKTDWTKEREATRRWAVLISGDCEIQEGANNSLWPCGTCFIHALTMLGVDESTGRNDSPNRHNEVWRAILEIREKENDYLPQVLKEANYD